MESPTITYPVEHYLIPSHPKCSTIIYTIHRVASYEITYASYVKSRYMFIDKLTNIEVTIDSFLQDAYTDKFQNI